MRRLMQHAETSFHYAPLLNFHSLAELKIRSSWILADTTWGDAEAAAFSMPLPRLGYDPLLLGYKYAVVERSEATPLDRQYWIASWFLCMLSRGALDLLNQSFEEKRQEGHRILTEIGEAEYIQRLRRFYVPLPAAVELGLSLPMTRS